MKQYSFSIAVEVLEQFKEVLPVNRSKKILRNYLLNEYKLPETLEELQNKVEETIVQPYWMTDAEIARLDYLVYQCSEKGFSVSKSAIMRDIISDLVQRYKDNPIAKSKQHRQTFKVPIGTKQRLSKLINDRSLTYELSSFIMEGYIPSNDFPTMRNQEQEDLNFKTDIEVFDRMDEVSQEYGFKKGGRAKIFRDALKQFEQSIQSNPPRISALEQELKYLLKEYKDIEDVSVIREQVEKFLKE